MKRVTVSGEQKKALDLSIKRWQQIVDLITEEKSKEAFEFERSGKCPLCDTVIFKLGGIENPCAKCIYCIATDGSEHGDCTDSWQEWDTESTLENAKKILNELIWIKENQL